MTRAGWWVVVGGAAILLLVNVFVTATNLFELFVEDWFESATKLASVAGTVGAFLLLTGFLLLALGSSATKGNSLGQAMGSVPTSRPRHSDQVPSGSHAEPTTAESRLKRLNDLRDQGLLSPEEFDQGRARILETL